VLVLLFSFLQGEYRITAQTELEGSIQQVIAAPYNSYITSAPKKAGDTVSKGELIARLDDRELRLERKKWLTQRSQYRHEYNNAYAKQERAEVNISRAQMAQAEAELALVEERLRRSRLQAPFAGVVLSGDLSQRLGSFVEQGETLFEVAPLTNYRVILMVADNLIADVAIDQIGVLVLSALPSEKFEFVVTTITPVTEARDGNNFFRVEADITTLSSSLRPGMQGIGKITVGDRLLIANWTRGLIEWLQLQLWRWTP
jgi:multidrug resistance efflux pump